MSVATAQTRAIDAGASLSIGLCFLAAILEGFDIQAMGVAAPKLGAELHLDKVVLGQALSASNIGLVLGASLGGWLADRFGRKPVLIGAVMTFGAFTLATMLARPLALGPLSLNAFDVLFLARLATGMGFGAALPNIMAMAAEIAPPERRGASGAMMFCGMPAGGGTVALVSWLNPHADWRLLFLIGGLSPLIIAPLLAWGVRETLQRRNTEAGSGHLWTVLAALALYGVSLVAINAFARLPGAPALTNIAPWLALLPAVIGAYLLAHRRVLFGDGRALASLLLWVVFFPTLLVVYFILNWLPTFVVAKGYPADASQASMWFNYAAVIGALTLGALVDRVGIRWPLTLTFAGLVVALFALAQATSLTAILVLSGVVGFCVLGANFAFYGAAATYYPEEMRGRGAGAAVAWGRLGSVFGPLLGGYLLAGGGGPGSAVQAMAPFAVVAGLGVLVLTFVAKPSDGP